MSPPLCVLRVEAVPPALTGSVSRWMVEVAAGLWIGRPSAKVREFLWERVIDHTEHGTAVLILADSSDIGAELRILGGHDRTLLDFDGLMLTGRVPHILHS